MAENNHDFFASDLLCLESSSICFDDHDSLVTDDHPYQSNGDKGLIFGNGKPEPFIDLPSLNEESFGTMVERENQHSPNADYLMTLRSDGLILSMRMEALDWIWKVHSHFGFGVISFCLSITYLDRFLSVYEHDESKTWTVQLLGLACLSLAIKMDEINTPSIVEFKAVGPDILYDGNEMLGMESTILIALKWRMHSCTPCTFIDYFLRKFNGDHQITSGPLISRSMQLISSAVKGIDLLEFKPSEVATAVALFVSREMQSTIDLDNAVSSCYTHEPLKERVMKCFKLIQDLVGSSPSLGHKSPSRASGAECFIYKSDETSIPSDTSPENKKRRLGMTNSIENTEEKGLESISQL